MTTYIIEEVEVSDKYKGWESSEENALFHMNRASINEDWDVFMKILSVYPELAVDAMHLSHISGNESLLDEIYDKYREYIDTAPVVLWYQDTRGKDISLRDLELVVTNASLGELLGYITDNIRDHIIGTPWFEDLSSSKLKWIRHRVRDRMDLSTSSVLRKLGVTISDLWTGKTHEEILGSTRPENYSTNPALQEELARNALEAIARSSFMTKNMLITAKKLIKSYDLPAPTVMRPILRKYLGL